MARIPIDIDKFSSQNINKSYLIIIPEQIRIQWKKPFED